MRIARHAERGIVQRHQSHAHRCRLPQAQPAKQAGHFIEQARSTRTSARSCSVMDLTPARITFLAAQAGRQAGKAGQMRKWAGGERGA